jgi:hypothetical protein
MKTGIITLYYKNDNYGGNLQAYALEHYINQAGYSAEQICYSPQRPAVFSEGFRKLNPLKQLKGIVWAAINKKRSLKYIISGGIHRYWRIKKREKSIFRFEEESIHHSERVYYGYNYQDMTERYDNFIVGSDQVWNNQWGIRSVYFLDGIPHTKYKISYAASLGRSNWTDMQFLSAKKMRLIF